MKGGGVSTPLFLGRTVGVGLLLLVVVFLIVRAPSSYSFLILVLLSGAVCLGFEFVSGSRVCAATGGGLVGVALVGLSADLFVPTWRQALFESLFFSALVGAILGIIGARAFIKPPNTNEVGHEGVVGRRGEALETFATNGKVFVLGEIWQADVEAGFVEKGAAIEVVRIEEMKLLVRPVAAGKS